MGTLKSEGHFFEQNSFNPKNPENDKYFRRKKAKGG
jgi:hypothetical protein